MKINNKISAKKARKLALNYGADTFNKRMNYLYHCIDDVARRGFGALFFTNEGYSEDINKAIIAELEKNGYKIVVRNPQCNTYICWWDDNLEIGS